MNDNPFIPIDTILDIARKSRSMSVEERVAVGLPRTEAEACFAANQEAPVRDDSERLITALSVLSIGPEDTLLIKTGKDTTPDQLQRLGEILRGHFAQSVHKRIMVIPWDMEVIKVSPLPSESPKLTA